MRLSADQVVHVAKLANLPLSEKEEEIYQNQLSKILEYVEEVESVSSEVEPTFNVTGLSGVVANDEVSPGLTQQEALQNGNTKQGFFVTGGVFENE